MRFRARLGGGGWVIVVIALVAGCGPRTRYIVDRSAADFPIAPDYRDLGREHLCPGLEQTRTLLLGADADAAVWLALGAFHLALGELDSAEIEEARAIAGFERSMAALPAGTTPSDGEIRARADAYLAHGVVLAARRDLRAARAEFARVDRSWLAPYEQVRTEKTRIARFNTALAWERDGRPERALREYDAILSRGDWPRACYGRACARAAAGRLDSALADFIMVSHSRAEERRLAHYHIGRLRELAADTSAAVAAYEAFRDAETFGLVPVFRDADSLAPAARAEMIAGLERTAEQRTRGLFRDAGTRIERLRRARR